MTKQRIALIQSTPMMRPQAIRWPTGKLDEKNLQFTNYKTTFICANGLIFARGGIFNPERGIIPRRHEWQRFCRQHGDRP